MVLRCVEWEEGARGEVGGGGPYDLVATGEAHTDSG